MKTTTLGLLAGTLFATFALGWHFGQEDQTQKDHQDLRYSVEEVLRSQAKLNSQNSLHQDQGLQAERARRAAEILDGLVR